MSVSRSCVFWRLWGRVVRTHCSSLAIWGNGFFSSRFRGRHSASMCGDGRLRCGLTIGPRIRSGHGLTGCLARRLPTWMAIPRAEKARFRRSMGLSPKLWCWIRLSLRSRLSAGGYKTVLRRGRAG